MGGHRVWGLTDISVLAKLASAEQSRAAGNINIHTGPYFDMPFGSFSFLCFPPSPSKAFHKGRKGQLEPYLVKYPLSETQAENEKTQNLLRLLNLL